MQEVAEWHDLDTVRGVGYRLGPSRLTEVSLRLRLTALFTIAAAIVVVVGGILYLHAQRRAPRRDRCVVAQPRSAVAAHGDPAHRDDRARGATQQQPRRRPADRGVPAGRGGGAGVARPAGTRLLHADDQAVLRAGKSVLADRTENDIGYRILVEPVSRPNGLWTVLVAAPTEEEDEANGQPRPQPPSWPVRLVVLLSTAGAWVLGSAALRAVDRMRGSVEAITAADMTARVKVPPGRDELAALGSTFNALLGPTRLRPRPAAPLSSLTPATSCAGRWRCCAWSSSWPFAVAASG